MVLTGRVSVHVNGTLVARGKNTVVSVGLNWVAARLAASPPAVMSHMAFGPSGVAIALSQTALQGAEVFARKAVTPTVLGAAITYAVSFTHAGSSVTVREVGIFNAATAGTMLTRFLPQEFTIFDTDAVEVSWTLEAS